MAVERCLVAELLRVSYARLWGWMSSRNFSYVVIVKDGGLEPLPLKSLRVLSLLPLKSEANWILKKKNPQHTVRFSKPNTSCV